jgi:WD40 repeat protein
VIDGGAGDWWPDPNAIGTYLPLPGVDGRWAIHATDTDEVIYEAPPGWSINGVSWDGTQAVINDTGVAESSSRDECGSTHLVSTIDDSHDVELSPTDCVGRAIFSPDGKSVYAFFWTRPHGIFDTETGELLVDFSGTDYSSLGVAFTHDGSALLMGNSRLYLLDLPMLLSGAPVDEALLLELPGHDALVLRYKVSPDGSMGATGSWDEPFKLWDLQTGKLLGEFGGVTEGRVHDGGFHPTLPYLMVTTPPNEVRIHTLDIDELIAIAMAGLSRDMTEEECQRYFREPCRSP